MAHYCGGGQVSLEITELYMPLKRQEYPAMWLPGLFPGVVGGLIGDSTVGKSWLSLELLHDWALTSHLTGVKSSRRGRTGYLSLEDGADTIHERFHHIGSHLTKDQKQRASQTIKVWDWSTEPSEPWSRRVPRFRALVATVDILIVDHLRRLHALDENSNTDMAQVMGDLQVIAAKAGTTILTIHHVPVRQNEGDPVLRARGAAIIQNTWRWCGGLSSQSDGSIAFTIIQARRGTACDTVLGYFSREATTGMLRPLIRGSNEQRPKYKEDFND